MDDTAATDDLHTMLLAWNGGTDTQRALALELADRNRERANRELYEAASDVAFVMETDPERTPE